MPKKDARVDAYIASSAAFAKPILNHLRQLVHETCPAAEEAIKWKFPVFMHHGMLCSMAAFKEHCTFGFWKHALIIASDHVSKNKVTEAMGQMGRLMSLADLPPDKLLRQYIQQAVRLNEAGVKVPRPKRSPAKRELTIPEDFRAALQKNRKAQTAFENFSPSHRREYVEWISEAKRKETRTRRLNTAIEWLADGKSRNWKYENC